MIEAGPHKLYSRVDKSNIVSDLQNRVYFYLRDRWNFYPDRDFNDGFRSLIDDVPAYRNLRLPSNATLREIFSSMSDVNRADLAGALASLGVSKAVLARDFLRGDARMLEGAALMHRVRPKGRPPSCRQIFRSVSKAAQANCFVDCFVRRRAYGAFEAAVFLDVFQYALEAYHVLNDGFADVLCPSEAWAVIESVLSGRLTLDVCVRSHQPYFRFDDPKCVAQSPFLKRRPSSPSAADRSLMYLLDQGGYLAL